MKTLRILVAAALFVATCILPTAQATSFSTDQSDLWYAVDAPGWGVQLVQRGSLIYATIFTYDQHNAPIWYVATLNPQSDASTWSGSLYLSTGPWIDTAPNNLGLYSQGEVGMMSWVATDIADGVATFSVDGVTVTRNMTRETIAGDDFSGNYAGGGIHSETVGCSNTSLNGTREVTGGILLGQIGIQVAMDTRPVGGPACAYTGYAEEFGQMGSVSGTFTCSDGSAGTFQLSEMQVTQLSMSSRFQATYSTPLGCQTSGWFAGARFTSGHFSN